MCRSVDAPILLDTIRTALPEGVQLACHQHTEVIMARNLDPDPIEILPGSGSLLRFYIDPDPYGYITWIRIRMKILRYLDTDPYGNFYLDPDPYGHEDITWIRIPMEILRYLDLDPYGDFT